MRAVLISAYVVLLAAIVSEEPAHAQGISSDQLSDLVAAVNQNSDRLASLSEAVQDIAQSLTSINAFLHQNMPKGCMYDDKVYPQGSTVEGDSCNPTCSPSGKWTLNDSSSCCMYNDKAYPEWSNVEDDGCRITCKYGNWQLPYYSFCCIYNAKAYPSGTTVEGESCNLTCSNGTLDSSMCCGHKDAWYPTGTTINEEGSNRTCEDGYWNTKVYSPIFEFRTHHRKENVEYYFGRNWVYSDWESSISWQNSLSELIKPYESSHRRGGVRVDVKDCSEYNDASHGQVCKFDSQWLGRQCNKDEEWGYARGNPCIILKMHRRFGWHPAVYQTIQELPDDLPEDLKELIKQKTEDNRGDMPRMVWVHCKAEDPAHELKLEYTPWQGFPAYYFPYRKTPGYLDPIVAVRFVAPANNVRINIECKAYAKNIQHNVSNIVRGRKESFGIIHFQVHKIN